MGWFSSSPEEKRAAEIRSGAVAPSRSERQQCWASRDAYFACLDKASIIDPLKNPKDAAKACGSENVALERDCAAQWVTHFKKFRVANYQKERRLKALAAEGGEQMRIAASPGEPVKR